MKTGEDDEVTVMKEEEFEAMSEFEKNITNGRYVLEKRKHKIKTEKGSRVISADFSRVSKRLVLGFSNGLFSVYDLENLDHLHSF